MRLRTIVLFLALVASASVALAADEILRLKSGHFAVGKVVAVDETGVTLEQESGTVKYDWDAITPLSVYEIRVGLLDPGTSQQRADLALHCLAHGLYPHARREISVAQSLPKPDAKQLAELAAAVDQAEADFAFARIEQLVAEEDYQGALEEIRNFLRDAPPSDHTRRARGLVADLIRRQDAFALRVEEEDKAREQLEKNEQLTARIEKLLAEVAAGKAKADTAYAEALRYHELGNVTRTKKGYLAAEKALLANNSLLKKLQRLVREGVAATKASEERRAIRERLVEIYLGMARLYVGDRNYRRGIPYINRVLYLDPVNRAALDLRREVDENRIRRSARGLTNTPGVRVTGGGSAK